MCCDTECRCYSFHCSSHFAKFWPGSHSCLVKLFFLCCSLFILTLSLFAGLCPVSSLLTSPTTGCNVLFSINCATATWPWPRLTLVWDHSALERWKRLMFCKKWWNLFECNFSTRSAPQQNPIHIHYIGKVAEISRKRRFLNFLQLK